MNLAIAHYRESAIQLFGLIGGISAAFVMATEPHPLPPVTHFNGFRLQLSSSDSDREEEIERGCDMTMELSDPRVQIEVMLLYIVQYMLLLIAVLLVITINSGVIISSSRLLLIAIYYY